MATVFEKVSATFLLRQLQQVRSQELSTNRLTAAFRSAHPELIASSEDAVKTRVRLRKVLATLETLKLVQRPTKTRWRLTPGATWGEDPFQIAEQTVTLIAPQTSEPSTMVLELRHKVRELTDRLLQLESEVSAQVKTVEIKTVDVSGQTTVKTLNDVTLPAVFEDVLQLAQAREHIMLVGPAGCGKTFVAEVVSKALGLRFAALSCSAGMSETHLLGRAVPNISTGEVEYQATDFLECYEGGGVFLLDEFDAADSNLLLCINSALANGYANVPNRVDKPRAIQHKNFVLIVTANTFGRGADRVYSGRNQLDEATLDRFRIGTVECYYDAAVEARVCPDSELREQLQHVRRRIEAAGLRRIMSTRFMKSAYKMKQMGWSEDKILEVFFSGWPETEKAKVQ